jgi:hypothetical protein
MDKCEWQETPARAEQQYLLERTLAVNAICALNLPVIAYLNQHQLNAIRALDLPVIAYFDQHQVYVV